VNTQKDTACGVVDNIKDVIDGISDTIGGFLS
jgi:hypothetical protein